MNRQYQEWQAWQEIVKELRRLGIEINKQEKLANLLNDWADKFYKLRTKTRKQK